MKLALRQNAATDATFGQKLGVFAIKLRLVTQYPHGGIVIGDKLYHATANKNLHVTDFTPGNWTLIDLGNQDDARVLKEFSRMEGMKYDWFSLLSFIAFRVSDRRKIYCYEWCWYAMTGTHPNFRVTPEMLLILAFEKGGKLA